MPRRPIRAGLAIADRLAKSAPGNAGWQSDLAASYKNVGDVQKAQGALLAALTSYQASLAIIDGLAKSRSRQCRLLQRGSTCRVLHNYVGLVLQVQGNLPAALTSDQASLAIKDLGWSQFDLNNSLWQRDLALVRTRGSAGRQPAQGDLPAALTSYQTEILGVFDRLASS